MINSNIFFLFKFSVAECKAKWASLRNSYARALRDGKARNTSSGSRKRRKWYLADAMDFLYAFMNQHKPSSTNTVEFWEERTNSLDAQEIEYENEEEVVEHQLDNNLEYEDPNSVTRRSFSPAKLIKPAASDDIIGPVIEHLLSEAKSRERDNPEWSFFRSLMPDVAKLSAKRRRKFKEVVLTSLNKLMEEDEIENAEFSEKKEYYIKSID